MKTLKDIKNEWDNITLMKVFEKEVTDKRTNETDYIIFDIAINGKKFVAQHVALTEEQENSNKIAFVSIDIDAEFSLDENLQELFDACQTAIIDSDFYELP